MNIVEPILYHCKLNPWDVAICVPGSALESITYGRLEKLIHNVARTALSGDLRPRNVVALSVNDVIVHAALIYGLARAGITTLSLHGTNVPKNIPIDAIVTDAPQLFSQAPKVIRVDPTWLAGDGKAPHYDRIYQNSDDDICRIVLTSGSADEPKGVPFSHRLLWDRVAIFAFQKGAHFQRCSRLFCDRGIGTAEGFLYAFHMLLRGGTIYFLGSDPVAILQYFDLHKIQGMATSPAGLADLAKYLETDSTFECRFDHIICQGATLSRDLSERVRARMCPQLFCSYGATESGSIAFAPASILADTPGAVGYVAPGVTVDVVDRNGQIVPAGQQGAIRVRSPMVAQSYVGDEAATNKAFRDGYFYTDDFGYVTEDRLMVITGREKTGPNLDGDSSNPEIPAAKVTAT